MRQSHKIIKSRTFGHLLVLGLAVCLNSPARAEVGANYDVDSYVFIGTKNDADDFISLNPHREDDSHFNFAMVRFPVEELVSAEQHRLRVHLETFIEGDFLTGSIGPTTTGTATVHVVALGGPIEQYFLPSVNKRLWYDLLVHGQPIVATFTFSAVESDGLGSYEVDVTPVVESWIADSSTAYGFGLWAEAGSVELGSVEGAMRSGRDIAPRIVSGSGPSFASYVDEFLTDVPPDQRDPDDDADRNGSSNIEEYFFATDAGNSFDRPAAPEIVISATEATVV